MVQGKIPYREKSRSQAVYTGCTYEELDHGGLIIVIAIPELVSSDQPHTYGALIEFYSSIFKDNVDVDHHMFFDACRTGYHSRHRYGAGG